jgi:transposase
LKGAKVEQAEGRWWFKYSPDFKRQAVDRMMAGECVSALAKELGVGRRFLYQWREAGYGSAGQQPPIRERRPKAQPPELSAEKKQVAKTKIRIAELERLVGRQAAELDFFAAALRNIEEPRPINSVDFDNESTPRSKPARKAK